MSGFPAVLLAEQRWVLWRETVRHGIKTKVPFTIRNVAASSTNPAHWSSFAEVTTVFERRPDVFDGRGIVLGDLGNGSFLVGLDLDSCLNSGTLADWAKPFLAAAPTYTEVSPSGGGLKAFAKIRAEDVRPFLDSIGVSRESWGCKRAVPGIGNSKEHGPAVEIYCAGRFFTVTGNAWTGAPEDIRAPDAAALKQLAALVPRPHGGPTNDDGPPTPGGEFDLEVNVDAVQAKLSEAFGRSPKLKARWFGNTEGLTDTSGSGFDFSLGAMLKALGFNFAEMRYVLMQCDHGTGRKHEHDLRHWQRVWQRTTPKPKPEDDNWPEPVLFFADQRRDAPALTERHVPEAIWPFVSDTAERLGVATSSVALGAIVSLSAAISDQWQLQPKRSDYTWTEAARLWGVILGPPSILKSPIITTTTAPVEQLEVGALKQWQEDMAAWRERQAAAKEAGEKSDEPEPQRRRFLIESATIEALQEVLRDDSEGKFVASLNKVLVRVDELSELFAGMDRYSTARGGSDRGAYLRLYNGGRFSIDRIGRGSFSTRSWSACLLGGIQPDPIQRIAKQAVDDGLLQRCMLDVPATQAAGLDRSPNWPAILAYRTIFPVLSIMRPARDSENRPNIVKLHADGHAAREDIDQLARVMAEMPNASPRLQATFGKWSGLFARLSLTFHLVEIAALRAANNIGPPIDVVTAETAERVRRYMREILLPNLLRGEAVMYGSSEMDHATWIAGHILARRLDRIAARDIMRYYRPLRAPEERDVITSTMEAMTTLGWVEPEPSRNEARPPTAWNVNPKVHLVFAELAKAEAARREAIRAAIAGQNLDVDDVA